MRDLYFGFPGLASAVWWLIIILALGYGILALLFIRDCRKAKKEKEDK